MNKALDFYRDAKALVDERGGDFDGAKSDELLSRAESLLSLTFPPSYRQFLLELGCGSVDGFEVYGVIHEDFERSSVPDAIWLTLDQRRNGGLSTNYVLIGDVGDGTRYAIDTSVADESGENPVVLLSFDARKSERIASSFGEFLFESIKSLY